MKDIVKVPDHLKKMIASGGDAKIKIKIKAKMKKGALQKFLMKSKGK